MRRKAMKSRISKQFSRATTAFLAGVLVLGAGIAANAQSEQSPNGLKGTWRVQVTPYDCSTGTPRPPFWSLLSFARGGTLTETTSAPVFLPGQRTPGHGVWSSIDENTYSAVSEAFILFDSPTNPPGLKTGTQKIIQAIVLNDENHFSSLASVKFFNADGTTVTGCAEAAGTRLSTSGDHP
jgi:hypothetical protein